MVQGVVIHTSKVTRWGITLLGINFVLFKAKPTAINIKIAVILEKIVIIGKL